MQGFLNCKVHYNGDSIPSPWSAGNYRQVDQGQIRCNWQIHGIEMLIFPGPVPFLCFHRKQGMWSAEPCLWFFTPSAFCPAMHTSGSCTPKEKHAGGNKSAGNEDFHMLSIPRMSFFFLVLLSPSNVSF